MSPGVQIGSPGYVIDKIHKSFLTNVFIGDTNVGLKIINTRQVQFNQVAIRTTVGTGGVTAFHALSDGIGAYIGDLVFTNCEFVVGNTTGTNTLFEAANGGSLTGIHFSDSAFYAGNASTVLIALGQTSW